MSDDEINQAICEAIGRKYHRPSEEEKKSGSYYQYEPRFTDDLNAIHEIETALPKSGFVFHDYCTHLLEICTRDGNHPYCAEAKQRCEAYLRLKGKWRDK